VGGKKVGVLGRVYFSDRSAEAAVFLLDSVPCEAIFRPLDTHLRPERGQPFAMKI